MSSPIFLLTRMQRRDILRIQRVWQCSHTQERGSPNERARRNGSNARGCSTKQLDCLVRRFISYRWRWKHNERGRIKSRREWRRRPGINHDSAKMDFDGSVGGLELRIPYFAIPGNESLVFPDLKVKWIPVVPVRIVDKRMQVKGNKILAVVDSGSDNCLFHSDALEPFGIELESGIREDIGGIGKQVVIPVYYHDVRIMIGVDWRIQVRAGFSRELTVAGILGRNGFFDAFRITFDHTADTPYTSIEQIVRTKLN